MFSFELWQILIRNRPINADASQSTVSSLVLLIKTEGQSELSDDQGPMYPFLCLPVLICHLILPTESSLRDSAANTVRICIVTPHVIFSVRICKRNFTQVSVVGTTCRICVTIVFLSYKHTEEYYCLCVCWLAAGKQAYLKPLSLALTYLWYSKP